MIRNKKQYTALLEDVRHLKDNVEDLESIIKKDENVKPELKLQLSDFKRLLSRYKKEIDEYERLISDNLSILEFDSSKDDMNQAIMSFRIASKYTQKQIAQLMYIQEQQIQRYEQQDYLSASFERILQLLEALGVQLILKKEFKQEKKFEFILPGNGDEVNIISKKVIEQGQLLQMID